MIIRKLLFKHNLFKMPFYAVAKGRSVGIYTNWPDCQRQVTGFQGPRFKKFNTRVQAEEFIINNGDPSVVMQQLHYSSSDSDSDGGVVDLTSPGPKKNIAVPEIDLSKINADSNPELAEALKRIDQLKRQLDDLKQENAQASTSSTAPKKPKRTAEPVNVPVKVGKYSFTQDTDGYVHVYTDGSCEGNGKPNACAGLGVYFGENHELNLAKAVNGRATNNCGEIQASIEAIRMAKGNGVKKLLINTDSKFLIDSVTKWMPGWKKKGWRTASGDAVKNKDDFERLDEMLQAKAINVKWKYVAAHAGIIGNERADALARQGAEEYRQIHRLNFATLINMDD